METIYFEDIDPGEVRELGSFTLTEEEIVEFARRYDPQPFHVDPEAAEDSFYGGLIASGWHTAVSCMRLVVDGLLLDAATIGAVAAEELTWSAPVRPGQEISARNEIMETRLSESHDDRGYVRNQTVGTDGDGNEVISMIGINIFLRRGTD